MSETIDSRPTPRIRARLATADQLLAHLLPQYLDPLPTKRALVGWLDRAGVSKLKANPAARRGGGTAWYSVAQVEKLLRSRAGLAGYAEASR